MKCKTRGTTIFGRTLSSFLCSLAFATAISCVEADEVALNWSDNSDNEDGFEIERSIEGGDFESLAQVAADAEDYIDTSVTEGVNYTYRVRAFNSFGFSGYTNAASEYINVAPTVSTLESLQIKENETSEALAFSISDFELAAEELTVEVTSNNSDLLDASGILVSGSGSDRFLSLNPKLNTSGEAKITISVSDGEDVSISEFAIVVNSFVFPTLEMAIETISAGARAGEPFTLRSIVSDLELVSAVSYFVNGELVEEVSSAPFASSFDVPESGVYTLSAIADIVGREEVVTVEESISVGSAPADAVFVSELRTLSSSGSSNDDAAGYDLVSDAFYLENESGQISGSSDTHRYYYLRAEGDLSIAAKVSDLQASSNESVAGLMLRSALYGKSAHVSLLQNGAGKLEVRTRESKGGTTNVSAPLMESTEDSWLRIDKTGTRITYFSRVDSDSSWILLHEDELDLGSAVFLGFTVAGGSANGPAEAIFTNVSLQGEIMPMGNDATEPEIPTGLIITSI
ncbi:hypothetical protein VDG1235_1111 [Verrucomicrobiia bacterium DG1235]|nr:hypothetical protein VDG1235_1111 [Verrucomicrobiae bacterium DG1235]